MKLLVSIIEMYCVYGHWQGMGIFACHMVMRFPQRMTVVVEKVSSSLEFS